MFVFTGIYGCITASQPTQIWLIFQLEQLNAIPRKKALKLQYWFQDWADLEIQINFE